MGAGQDAVTTVFRKYVVFTGRARRREYWYFILFLFLTSLLLSIIDSVIFGSAFKIYTPDENANFVVTFLQDIAVTSFAVDKGPFNFVFALLTFLPTLSVQVRRLHDTSRSAWWLLVWLVPIVGWIILVVFSISDSHDDNRYGPNPKALHGEQIA